jgi:hypothetical protein
MNQDLQLSLDENAKQWLALSQTISLAEQVSFGNIHDRFFARYGPNFMAHVYRSTIEQLLPNLPTSARHQFLEAFQQTMDEAVIRHAYALPTLSDCAACHSHKF